MSSAQPQNITNELPSASFGRRMMALVYDGFLMLGVSFGYGVLVFLVRKLAGIDTLQPPSNLSQVVILIGLWLCCSLFYSWSWFKVGQTLGMKSWRIRLQTPSGSTLNWQQCWQRCLIAPILNGLGGIGLLWCLIDENGNSLQDRITGTRVVLLPKDKS